MGMIKVEHMDAWGFEHAIRGMRNPLNSWVRSDSEWLTEMVDDDVPYYHYVLGEADLVLMRGLIKAGTEHRKFLRQIMVSMDITAPLYWWKEFDTYKVGTTANSCSTMHTVTSKPFTMDDFSTEHLLEHEGLFLMEKVVQSLNEFRQKFLLTKDKVWWWQIIQSLPTSFNQKRTVTMNYENVLSIMKQRQSHKLNEWHQFIQHLEELPHLKLILSDGDEEHEEGS